MLAFVCIVLFIYNSDLKKRPIMEKNSKEHTFIHFAYNNNCIFFKVLFLDLRKHFNES